VEIVLLGTAAAAAGNIQMQCNLVAAAVIAVG
jgi:hypothetical protein